MSSTLSHLAIRRIVFLIENDDRPACTETGQNTPPGQSVAAKELQQVNRMWRAMYTLSVGIKPAPPLDYFDSWELALVLKREVDDEDVRAIFGHGKPLEFWGCPGSLVSKLVKAFGELQKEPAYLDVTVIGLSYEMFTGSDLPNFGFMMSWEAWPQAYADYLPCRACTAEETVCVRSIPHRKYPGIKDPNPAAAVDVVVDTFHVTSKRFGKQLTVELHYQLDPNDDEDIEQSSFLHKITIRLVSAMCPFRGSQPGVANRSSATMLLVPEFACEVYGFLDRAHIGSSLLANRELHDLLCRLKQRLPLHHLMCAFFDEFFGGGSRDKYMRIDLMEIRHVQRDSSYVDLRCFAMPSMAGAEHDSALIRRYLSNSYATFLQTRQCGFPFALKMLASLAVRNFSVGCVTLMDETLRLSDYRSMDAILGGMRVSELKLCCYEHRFVELVKTTDFFRRSTVQGLRKLKLILARGFHHNSPSNYEEHEPRGVARSKSPLWVSGIYQLRNCKFFQVVYKTDRHLRSIERKIVHVCEEFERGKIIDIVDHFQLVSSSKAMSFAFNPDNLFVSGMKVDEETWPSKHFEWDVYRFRNASTGECLTACVGRNNSPSSVKSILHIVKGEVLPDAGFAWFDSCY